MKKKNLKKFIILSISGVLVLITGIILACSDYDYDDFYDSFFAPETSNAKEFKPFFRSLNNFYDQNSMESTNNTFDSINIAEWRSFLGSKVSRADLKFLVYQSRIGEIDSLLYYLKNNKFPLNSYLKHNSLYYVSDKTIIKEFLYYLGFAKRCEPFATYIPEMWDEDASAKDPRNDIFPMLKLIEGGAKTLTNVTSEFIGQRYIFQIVRLFYNTKEYNNCITYYNAHSDAFKSESSIKYRSMGYAAAAYYKLKKYSEANYLYASIYDKCNEMKVSAFLSFHPQEEADWNGSLQLAQNNREKTALWHLLGIYADPLRAMKQIYKLDPKSDLLDLLLVRSVNIAEESFIPAQTFISSKNDSDHTIKTSKIDPELLQFLKEVADKKNTNKPYLWNLTTGYLLLASSDYKLSEKYLKNTEKDTEDDKLVAEQIRIFRLISKIEQYNKPSEKAESELTTEITWLDKEPHEANLRNSAVYLWALHRLSQKYEEFGDIVKAQCFDINRDKLFYDNPDKMKSMIALMDKPNKSGFEKLILSIHPYSKSDLLEYQAIDLIYQYKFREALSKFDQCKGCGDKDLMVDPFIIHINDCHDCDQQQKSTTENNTKYAFVKRLAEMEEFTSSDSKKLAQNYFLLANGLYNMTYFGNARIIYRTPMKYDYIVSFDYYSKDQSLTDRIFNCSKSQEYYNKAMNMSADKEFKAKCCFMAAKCEQNIYFSSPTFDDKQTIKSSKYFQQLQETYSKTNYYNEILKECGYFSTYQTKWILKHHKGL